jgi:adenylate cyclase
MDAPHPPDVFLFGSFRLDRSSGGLYRRAEGGGLVPVSIGSRALDVLGFLVERHGDLVSKDDIMAGVWPDTVVEEANLTVQISTLRRTLDQGRPNGSWIQTVPGRGYRFVGAVTRPAAPAPGSDATPPAETEPPRRRQAAAITAPVIGVIAVIGVIVLAAAFGVQPHRWFLNPNPPAPLSIVVLPFTNLGGDPEQEYFADAISDDLTTDLSRIAGSVVIAHSTAMTYRDKPSDVRQIGRDLDVRYALEGSVRRLGDQVEVNAQLIDTGTGAHVWADRFDTDRRNLVVAQSDITGRLARSLHLELLEAAGRRVEQAKTVNPDASDLAMRGWVLWYRPFSPTNRQAAARAFEQALEIDQRSTEAKTGLATILVSNMGLGLSRAPQQDGAQAERLLHEAIEQGADISRAHEVLGALRRIQNRLDEARIEYETAVALDHNNSHALLGLGQALMFLGRPADAIPAIERSIRLDLRDPNAAFGQWSLGTCHLLLGDIDTAADLLRKARAGNPRISFFQLYLAGALGLRGDIDEARAALAEAIRLNPAMSSMAGWAAAQPWIGHPAFVALRDKTMDIGLRRAGMPDR